MPHRFLAWADRLCAYDHCKVPLPWFAWHGKADATARLHRKAMALGNGHATHGILLSGVAALLHLVRGTRECHATWRRLRRACTRNCGVGPARQLALLLVAAFRYNLPPKTFYAVRLFRLERRRWAAVFSHRETTLILAEIERRVPHPELWTKQGWAEFCARHDVPSVRVAATARDGKLQVLQPAQLQPGRDLFVKPDVAYSSLGAVMLIWNAATQGWDASGAATGWVPPAGLEPFLTAIAPDRLMIVQTRLRNAPDLADLATRALVNMRVITLHIPGKGVEAIMAVLRMPPGDEPASDVVGSTICSVIDRDTGRLGPVRTASMKFDAADRHPRHGAQVRGRVVSSWPQMRALALATHAKLPFMPVVGWDVVATTDGVKILEANAVWHGHLGQGWGEQPLGETAWPGIMLATLGETAGSDAV